MSEMSNENVICHAIYVSVYFFMSSFNNPCIAPYSAGDALKKALSGAYHSCRSARAADRYLREAFISHSVDIKLIQNLHPVPRVVDW